MTTTRQRKFKFDDGDGDGDDGDGDGDGVLGAESSTVESLVPKGLDNKTLRTSSGKDFVEFSVRSVGGTATVFLGASFEYCECNGK